MHWLPDCLLAEDTPREFPAAPPAPRKHPASPSSSSSSSSPWPPVSSSSSPSSLSPLAPNKHPAAHEAQAQQPSSCPRPCNNLWRVGSKTAEYDIANLRKQRAALMSYRGKILSHVYKCKIQFSEATMLPPEEAVFLLCLFCFFDILCLYLISYLKVTQEVLT